MKQKIISVIFIIYLVILLILSCSNKETTPFSNENIERMI